MGRQNCWQYKRCGRELGGENAESMGVCPAASEDRLDGVNGGLKGGRACWVVAGTMCNGKPQGSFVDKYRDCALCDFFNKVRDEEGESFNIAALELFRKD